MTMNSSVGNDFVAGIFSNRADAEAAINALRQGGVPDSAISVVAQHGGHTQMTNVANADGGDDSGNDALRGTAVGAGIGALFGLAAAAIPGVGPFITAGFLVEALGAAGGGAVAGAVVGGTSGGLATALANTGHHDERSAQYYANQIEQGGTYVAVDLRQANVNPQAVLDTFQRHNGQFAS